MPAPKNPNTAAATAANVARKHERWSWELMDAGWVVVSPQDIEWLLQLHPSDTLGNFLRKSHR